MVWQDWASSGDASMLALAWTPLGLAWVFGLPWIYKIGTLLIVAMVLVVGGNQAYERSPDQVPKVVRKFHFKQQYDMKAKQGFSLGAWLEVLGKRWRHIDWKTYWYRVLCLTGLACMNSVLGLYESLVYGKKVEETELNDSPVFILGHPRTGTTHLHYLLAKDDEQFIFPNTFQCGFPHGMLALKNFTPYLAGSLDKTRPMDNVALSLDCPQEDELATNVMTAGTSPYMPLTFMTREPEFRKFYSFETATQEEKGRWIEAFMWFLKKVTFASEYYNCSDVKAAQQAKKPRRLLLKSPVHVSRMKLLHQLFPKAQFIYIHRNPYVVWKSAANMADQTYWYFYLAKPTDEHITEFILKQYETLYEDYVAMKDLIPKEQLYEISYADLTKDTIGSLEKIYKHFDWSNFGSAKGKFQAYLKSLGTFKKNKFVPMDEEMRKYIYERWKPSFERFGYDEKEVPEE